MDCQWSAVINILPPWMREQVDELGKNTLQEIRLRITYPPELICKNNRHILQRLVQKEDLEFVVNTASRYSPWAAQTVQKGYITTPGGHRIGLCGSFPEGEENFRSLRELTSLCIRIARQFSGIGKNAPPCGNLLIIGKPGSGKTTLLRDVIRCRSENGQTVCVVDERQELFPSNHGKFCFDTGRRTDVLSGCKKSTGVDMALRVMSPDIIAVDEITAQEDCQALIQALWCGVGLLATAHATGVKDLFKRRIYAPIMESRLFDTLLILQSDKSWRTERIIYEL